MGSHKTKNQLEIELNELKCSLSEKCMECDFLTKDNRTKSEAVVNACADLKNMGKDLEDARTELKSLKESNKKLADQFYDYRTELVKVRKELADAIENRDSLKVELEGVRGALKRESELRVDTEKKCDEYKQEMVKWKNEAGECQNRWEGICMENELLRNELNDVKNIQRKHNKLTLESLDNALKHWEYVDGKLSHDLSMPLESLIQLLDEYGVNDFCKLRERLMYGPTTAYSNALAQVRKLEKENIDLKAVADDLEKQRKEAVNAYEAAARRNDELQNEVNRLTQRVQDFEKRLPGTYLALPRPDDELCGRTIKEWMEINALLCRYDVETPEKLDGKLNRFSEYRVPLIKHMVCGPDDLDCRLTLLEKYQRATYDLQKSDGFKWLSDTIRGKTE